MGFLGLFPKHKRSAAPRRPRSPEELARHTATRLLRANPDWQEEVARQYFKIDNQATITASAVKQALAAKPELAIQLGEQAIQGMLSLHASSNGDNGESWSGGNPVEDALDNMMRLEEFKQQLTGRGGGIDFTQIAAMVVQGLSAYAQAQAQAQGRVNANGNGHASPPSQVQPPAPVPALTPAVETADPHPEPESEASPSEESDPPVVDMVLDFLLGLRTNEDVGARLTADGTISALAYLPNKRVVAFLVRYQDDPTIGTVIQTILADPESARVVVAALRRRCRAILEENSG